MYRTATNVRQVRDAYLPGSGYVQTLTECITQCAIDCRQCASVNVFAGGNQMASGTTMTGSWWSCQLNYRMAVSSLNATSSISTPLVTNAPGWDYYGIDSDSCV
jgi:hypothetical protein